MAKQIVVGVKVNQSELVDWKAIAAESKLTVPRWLRGLANAASKAPQPAQEASHEDREGFDQDKQKDAPQTGSVAVPDGGVPANAVSEIDAAPSEERLSAAAGQERDDHVPGAGHQDPDRLLASRPALGSKPTVNSALGLNPGAFRVSTKCSNSRCARLKMALCEACEELNKRTT